jgi:hypothetical protein
MNYERARDTAWLTSIGDKPRIFYIATMNIVNTEKYVVIY